MTDHVTRAHLAALRAWLQGVPVDAIAGRYLATDDVIPDARIAHRQILAIRDALIQRARQHNRMDLAMWLETPPRHSDRGMSRVSAALGELETLGSPQPDDAHAVELWFATVLARRLRAAGLATVGDLRRRRDGRGAGWWRQIPRIGTVAAATLERWLDRHGRADGGAVGLAVSATVRLESGLAATPPLERMQLPSMLDGHAGTNRAPHEHCAIDAMTDLQAIGSWLALWNADGETFRKYRREAERFLAWCVIERGRPFSSASTDDCRAYREWLADPQPAERWVGPRLPRDRAGWRPFHGPLSRDSRVHAETVLSALAAWLVGRGYLRLNPWTGLPRRTKARPHLQVEKAPPQDQWLAFVDWLTRRSALDAHLRTAYAAVILLRDSGLRCAEAAAADRAGLRRLAGPSGDLWGELDIEGKGDKPRAVPVSGAAYAALQAHWLDRGVAEEASGPLLAPLRRPPTPRSDARHAADGYSVRGLRHLVTRTFDAYLGELRTTDPQAAAVAIRVRPHALRHAFGTHALEAKVELDVVQSYMGHASAATTAIYTRASERRRQSQIGRLYGDADLLRSE
ncbi:phage integrase family protein [Paraburkholderia sp. C35]|uniref:phage integrase family protein n=1 Tax=Paraburkholderia sp. C35 TaxID=2126993 RepID=UPI000D686324|nr:phage integrase family protein [Paraburkholderia sp. C35]